MRVIALLQQIHPIQLMNKIKRYIWQGGNRFVFKNSQKWWWRWCYLWKCKNFENNSKFIWIWSVDCVQKLWKNQRNELIIELNLKKNRIDTFIEWLTSTVSLIQFDVFSCITNLISCGIRVCRNITINHTSKCMRILVSSFMMLKQWNGKNAWRTWFNRRRVYAADSENSWKFSQYFC